MCLELVGILGWGLGASGEIRIENRLEVGLGELLLLLMSSVITPAEGVAACAVTQVRWRSSQVRGLWRWPGSAGARNIPHLRGRRCHR